MKDKLDVILNLFEEKEIRSIWDRRGKIIILVLLM